MIGPTAAGAPRSPEIARENRWVAFLTGLSSGVGLADTFQAMHRFIPEPGETTPATVNPEHTAAIRRWTREVLHLPEDGVVTVADTPCRDPGCPLVETVVTVFDATGTRAWAFTRPAVAVTKMMIQQTLATSPRRSTQSSQDESP